MTLSCLLILLHFQIETHKTYKWAMSWENLFLSYANNKGADQPAHLCSLISAFVVAA